MSISTSSQSSDAEISSDLGAEITSQAPDTVAPKAKEHKQKTAEEIAAKRAELAFSRAKNAKKVAAAAKPDLPKPAPVYRALTRKPTVEWVNSASKIPSALWRDFFPETVEGRFWYVALEQSKLESQFQFHYALVKEGPDIIAIAPAFVMNVPMELVVPEPVAKLLKSVKPILPSLSYQRTLFVGSVCADEGTIGVKPGIALSDIVVPLQKAVEKKARSLKAPMIVWKDFPESVAPHLQPLLTIANAFTLVSFPGTAVTLTGNSIDDYFASLKSSRRYNLKKKLKKSKQTAQIVSSIIQNPDEQTLVDIFALFWQTYEKGKTKFEVLNLDFFHLMAACDKAWFILLREDRTEKLLAFMLCFKLGDKVINKFIGIDYTTPPDWFLYFRLWEAAVQWVAAQGVTELQSGQTGYRAKIEVGNTLLPLTNYCKHTNPLVNLIYRKVAQSVNWSTLDEDLASFLKAHPDTDSDTAPAAI
ncbi:MAG: GNAT family N-acetyltransferase [Candidatus Obscuribacterales bacterium]|nr:GNAT family N-acetyltransferase [Candidatus Obscuribacterales bacterium]